MNTAKDRRARLHRALDRVLDRRGAARDDAGSENAARNWEEKLLVPLAIAAENARDARVRRFYEDDLRAAKSAVDKLRASAYASKQFNTWADQLRYIARKNRI